MKMRLESVIRSQPSQDDQTPRQQPLPRTVAMTRLLAWYFSFPGLDDPTWILWTELREGVPALRWTWWIGRPVTWPPWWMRGSPEPEDSVDTRPACHARRDQPM